MKNKIFSLIALSVFALVLLVSGVSAANLADWSLNSTNSGNAINVNANVTANSLAFGSGIGTISYASNRAASDGWTSASIDANDYYQISLAPKTGYAFTINSLSFNYYSTTATGPTNFVLQYSKNADFSSPTNLTSITITTFSSEVPYSTSSLNILVNEGETIYFRWFAFGGTTGNFALSDVNLQGTTSTNLPSEIIASNAIANIGGLDIKRIDFTNDGLSGKTFGEKSQWLPFENINAEIQIKNTNSDARVNNIKVEWGLWDTQKNQWVLEMNDESEFDLKHGITKTMTVSFSINNKMDVDLSDLTDGDHYKFYVTATGEADDANATPVSVNKFQTASIVIESDFVILSNFQVPESVQCKEKVTLTADVWNIGDKDQNNVSVNVYNKELGINQRVLVGDINSFDRVSLNFDFKVPANAEEKSYPLTFTVYNEDNEIYKDNLNDDEAVFSVPLVVKGSCVYATASTTNVNVELSSGGAAGNPLVLTATVTNTGDKSVDYTFNLNGYASWAKLGSITPANVTLAPGESQEVVVRLDVDKDASGDKAFNFETYSNGILVTKQPLAATITSGFSFASITGGAVGSSAPLVIGLLSVILVVVIIIVLVKVAKK